MDFESFFELFFYLVQYRRQKLGIQKSKTWKYWKIWSKKLNFHIKYRFFVEIECKKQPNWFLNEEKWPKKESWWLFFVFLGFWFSKFWWIFDVILSLMCMWAFDELCCTKVLILVNLNSLMPIFFLLFQR